jgi:hypothetical protein
VLDKPSIVGRKIPRLYTPPRRRLTRRTSYGYAVVAFARDVLGEPLDPWEEWLVIHAGELLPDGRPRFRQVLCLVARQNGKTHVLMVLSLFWLFVERWPLVLGTSTTIGYALESWSKAVELAEATPGLAENIDKVRLENGAQYLATVDGCRYRIAASNRRGGRSLSIDRLVIDELREHHDWSAWAAAVPAMNARPEAQVFAISNQGDDTSVVLESLRAAALDHLATGEGDDRLGIFEWSAPDGCDIEDPRAWASANPNLGWRIDPEVISAAARRAARAGGEEEAAFRTEILCERVRLLASAVDPAAWARCLDPGDLGKVRGRVAVCLDVAPDGAHATLVAAAVLTNGRVRVEVVKAWDDTDTLRRELPGLLVRVRPQVFGWFRGGPAEALAADLRDRAGRVGWPPPGVTVEEIKAEVAACCMGLNEQVVAGRIAHSDDPLLNTHITGAGRLRRGDGWVFSRRGGGHVDAAYAAGGAAHLARTLPSPVGKPRLIVATERALFPHCGILSGRALAVVT